MIRIEKSAIDTARESMEKAMNHYKVIEQTAPPIERQAAWERFKEASAAYRTMMRVAYNL